MEIYVTGLGAAAYMKMHGYHVSAATKTDIAFEVKEEDVEIFKKYLLDFVNSEYASFDTWVTCLKKMPTSTTLLNNENLKKVDGIGLAAFMRQNSNGKWEIVSKVTSNIFAFYVSENYLNDFYAMQVAWTNSKERNFNAAVLSIADYKKTFKINKWK